MNVMEWHSDILCGLNVWILYGATLSFTINVKNSRLESGPAGTNSVKGHVTALLNLFLDTQVYLREASRWTEHKTCHDIPMISLSREKWKFPQKNTHCPESPTVLLIVLDVWIWSPWTHPPLFLDGWISQHTLTANKQSADLHQTTRVDLFKLMHVNIYWCGPEHTGRMNWDKMISKSSPYLQIESQFIE